MAKAKATAGVGKVHRSNETKFQYWLNREFFYEASDEPVTTAEWMTYLIEDDILPELYKKGYMLVIPKRDFIEKLLNHLYSFERDYLKGRCARSYKTTPHREDDYEYFFNIKFPDEFWYRVSKNNAIEWFADEDAFAYRVWIELPFWVAQYIDFKNSSATSELKDAGFETISDDENMLYEQKKKDVDPYVQDYYN
jgi:hypothetical protein